jgi:hypothetical protein
MYLLVPVPKVRIPGQPRTPQGSTPVLPSVCLAPVLPVKKEAFLGNPGAWQSKTLPRQPLSAALATWAPPHTTTFHISLPTLHKSHHWDFSWHFI